jgi:hypothetical protein
MMWWILPSPEEPDENGEISEPMPHPDGGMIMGLRNVATGVWRPLTWADLMREIEKVEHGRVWDWLGHDIG